jgi:hypothetical protein
MRAGRYSEAVMRTAARHHSAHPLGGEPTVDSGQEPAGPGRGTP